MIAIGGGALVVVTVVPLLLLGLLGQTVAWFALGRAIVRRIHVAGSGLSLVVGALVAAALAVVPLLGPPVHLVVGLTGSGAVVHRVASRRV